MDLAAQLVVSGLLAGAPYALAAWGMAVALSTGTLNLALGVFFTLGVYLALEATARGMPAFYAAPAAALAALVAGLCIERVFVRRLRAQPLAAAAALLALAVAGEGAFRLLWGAAPRSVPLKLQVVQIEHVVVAGLELFVAAGAALAFFAVVARARRTRTGLALRAAAENAEIASCSGLDIGRVRMWAFAASCAAAAAAGAFVSPITPVSPSMGRGALFLSLAAVTAGGPGLAGMLAASLALGVVTQSSSNYLAPQWGVVIPVIVLAGAAAWRRSPLWRRAGA
ncbi:MAG TPA: branched-chain amino acid ABC transporter permease [bacterium]|nr:branched-chain amino acid ABC transporter permease [bacterium]